MNVGTKDLKNELSRYLRLIRAGETVVVTDRGVPVAELRPIRRGTAASALALLEQEGIVTRGSGRPSATPPVAVKRSVSALVIEDRG
jgi:prevent-host-death family protein